MGDEIAELRRLLSKARRVSTGDVILPDDINALVDVAAKVVDIVGNLDKLFFVSQLIFRSDSYRIPGPFYLVEVPATAHYTMAEVALHAPAGALAEISIYSG